ncbi:hypothetical protein DPMN_162663 [Dreissena polymorpha]|uniref:Uncharacterized protein n=1 Tax=Dreissena polymorpha TaxID=45954 RepID=A0A9D4ITT7_DREPO|nr:hypothetical protein DPMN_162663 [Dreissena polymorpha]
MTPVEVKKSMLVFKKSKQTEFRVGWSTVQQIFKGRIFIRNTFNTNVRSSKTSWTKKRPTASGITAYGSHPKLNVKANNAVPLNGQMGDRYQDISGRPSEMSALPVLFNPFHEKIMQTPQDRRQTNLQLEIR